MLSIPFLDSLSHPSRGKVFPSHLTTIPITPMTFCAMCPTRAKFELGEFVEFDAGVLENLM